MSQQSDGTNNPSNPRHEEEDRSLRSILPIPDRRYPGLVVYDAKDPDARFPPITQLGRPTC